MKEIGYEKRCFDSILGLYNLYNQVNNAIKLAEIFDDERKMNIAPINQLRSALDHIFKAICNAQNEQQCDYQLKEAKEHLDRAGYDAFEILASIIGLKIIQSLNRYSTNTITEVFPDYYRIIKPRLIDIKESVSLLRSEQKIESEKSFSNYFDQISELKDIDKKVTCMIPSLEEFHTKRNKESRQEYRKKYKIVIIGWIITGLVTIIAALIGIFHHQINLKL